MAEATSGALARKGRSAGFPCVSIDSRTVPPGALFVATKGERFDGHDFLAQAIERGAAGVVVRRGTAVPSADVWVFEVGDTLAGLGALARSHRARFRIPLGAVGGSNGKTTTKEMTAAILRTRGPALATEGNLNNEFGVPLTLLRLSREHVAGVVEVGMSSRGELARLTSVTRPDAAVLTGIGPEHLEFLKDLDGVAEAEGELYRGLEPGAVAVVNADDPRCRAQAERVASGVRRISFGKSPDSDVRLVRATPLGREGQEICLESEEGESGAGAGRSRPGGELRRSQATVRLGFVGEHNALNAAAAAALARALGFSFEEISGGLSSARPYAHRSQVVAGVGGITILDDCYNANPASMQAAVAALLGLKGNGRAVAVLGDMLELGAAEERAHRELGELAGALLDTVAFFGPRSRNAFEACGLPGGRKAHFLEIEPMVSWLRPRLGAGDAVLVKGSRGMRLERVVEKLRPPIAG